MDFFNCAQLSAVAVSVNFKPTWSSCSQPGLLQSFVLRQLESFGWSLQQLVFPKAKFARSHWVTKMPSFCAIICVVAAQHQLLVCCGCSVLLTLPIIPGLQQLCAKKSNPMMPSIVKILVFIILWF